MKRVFLISMVCVCLSSCTYEEVVNYLKSNQNTSSMSTLNKVDSADQVDVDRGIGRPK